MTAFEYDRIGEGYAESRRPDPRIAQRIASALGDANSIVNVGAGAGSYEPLDRRAVAVEPSLEMISQRESPAAVVRGVAEWLPFRDGSFEAALAVLTIHHWSDWRRGVGELRRVAGSRVVILTWDPEAGAGFWLFEYFPGILRRDRRRFPLADELCERVGGRSEVVAVPHDCTDGFLGSRWRRPEEYLDARFRRAISGFGLLPSEELRSGVDRLATDLANGSWERRHGELRGLESLDLGYRLVVGEYAKR